MRTLLDLHDRMRAYIGNQDSDQSSSAVLRAASEAVLAISMNHDWNYFATYGRITTSAPYSTGTIAYDATGGTYERMVTLSGGVWPSWVANYGTLLVSTVPYDIDRRISDTVATLKATSAPADDIAAATAYQVYRARYDLPTDFVSIKKPIITAQNTIIHKIPLEEFIRRRNLNDGPSTPFMFTLADSGYGRNQILFWNPPDGVYQMEFEYKRKPTQPLVIQEETGSLSLTQGSTTVTGLSTAFTAAMAGAVLRVSADSIPPTGYDGIKPPIAEYLIDSFTSTTALELSEAAAASVSGRGYTISSRLDVREGPMFNYLCHMGMKRLRIAMRINMTPEELPAYLEAEKQAKSEDGQAYSGTDVARSETARVGMNWTPSMLRTNNS